MNFADIKPFLQRHHRGVISTYRPNGAMHASVVVCGTYQEQAAFVIVRGKSVKARHLRRDPRCTVLAVTEDWRSWATVEGTAQLFDYANTDAETMRRMLREVYRACGDKDHPDWEEYDRAMRQQDAVIVLVRPEKVYGQIR
jgi:PPOX class probable F420-dependent enzyme